MEEIDHTKTVLNHLKKVLQFLQDSQDQSNGPFINNHVEGYTERVWTREDMQVFIREFNEKFHANNLNDLIKSIEWSIKDEN